MLFVSEEPDFILSPYFDWLRKLLGK